MKVSAGLVLISNNKILIGHPAGASWKKSYSIPKGMVETNEDIYEAAIRETKEEVGIDVPKSLVENKVNYLDYKHDTGKIFKRVYYYIADVTSMNLPEVLPKTQLQPDEIDYAAFYNKENAMKYIMKLQEPLLNLVK